MIKSIKKSSVTSRRKFDQIFKREAVQNWLNSGESAEGGAQEMGLTANLLYAWRKLVPAAAGGESGGGQARLSGRSPGSIGCRTTRTASCAGAVHYSKKTLGILSEPSPNGMNGSTR